jgi:hypothetical protein
MSFSDKKIDRVGTFISNLNQICIFFIVYIILRGTGLDIDSFTVEGDMFLPFILVFVAVIIISTLIFFAIVKRTKFRKNYLLIFLILVMCILIFEFLFLKENIFHFLLD